MERGYIKFYRKILDSGIIQNPHALQLFCYLLLTAAYRPVSVDVRGEMIGLKPGQVVFGRQRVAEKLNISEKNVRTALKYLEKNEIVAIRPTKRYTLISIINWSTYQENYNDMGQQNGHEAAMRGPCEGHEAAMRGPCEGHEAAMRGPCEGHEAATIKEFKNLIIKEIKEIKNGEEEKEFNNQKTKGPSPPALLEGSQQKTSKKNATGNSLPEMKKAIEAYTYNQELREALLAWIEMRKGARKMPTGHALDLSLANLDRLAENDANKIAIVNQSVMRNWTGFFELKSNNASSGYVTSASHKSGAGEEAARRTWENGQRVLARMRASGELNDE